MERLSSFVTFVSVRFVYCVVTVISFYTSAQEMSTRVYTVKDGLPSTYVIGTFQDKLGYLWVSTAEGSCRFDGKTFTTDGLSNGSSAVVFVDSRLRYWANTPMGYVEYNRNKLISYPNPDSASIQWNFKIIETKEEKIWTLTSAGVFQLDSNKWKKIKLYPGYENHACRNIIETKDGLYINYGDLLVLRKPDDTYKIIGKLKETGYYYNDLSASAGQIFISTLDGIYEIINEQLVKLPGPLGRLKGLYFYYRDSKKRFWTGKFPMGLHLIPNGDTAKLISVFKPVTGPLINNINEDNQGNIWVTTGNGLVKIYEREFKIFDLTSVTENAILRNVLQPPTGPLLINNGSLTFKTFENGIFSNSKLHAKNLNVLPNNEFIIDNFAFDDKGRYWYSIRGFALAVQDGNRVYKQTKQLAHLGDEVFDVLWDSCRKKIIVAVRTQKFPCQFNDTTYSVLPIVNNLEVKGEFIRRLHQCVNGTVLLATDLGVMYSIDKNNICKEQLNEFGRQGRINRLYNDPSGDVWIIYYNRGLRRYTWQKDSLVFKEQLTKANGFSSDNVTSLCFDNKGKLWACTNSTVTVFAKNNTSTDQSYQMIGFFNSEELQTGSAIDARMTIDNKGNIWYFSSRYLICFYPDKINYNSPAPLMQIESVELNLQQTNWASYSDSLAGVFQLPYNLKLAHDNNTLGIYFKGISSSGTSGLKYSYQLQGLENTWSNPSSNDFVSFAKLPPGKYVFKVKSQLPNTDWSEPAWFSFEIKKAFWQTWWYFLLWAIVISASIYSVFRYRLMQKIKLLEMRNRISQDLHDEIGASLSGINLLSQVAAEKLQNNNPAEASEFLGKVKNYSQDVIEKLSDMVWLFNPQNDSIEKILQRLKYFAMSIASSRAATMHFATGKGTELINLSIRQRKAIYLVSKEAINNAVKYAECTNIYFHLTPQGQGWKLQIRDDGKGFLPTANKNGNGLKNMYARADEIGARFKIQSKEDAGTIIVMEL